MNSFSWWRRRLYLIIILLIFIIPLVITSALYILPAPIVAENQTIRVLDNSGHEVWNLHFDKWGTYIPLEKISPWLIKAAIAVEDQHFYTHHGYDVDRIIGSFFSNISAGDIVQGGSTITQQVAKNLYLSQEQTWQRKIEELFLALRLEAHYSKDTLIEAYLNSAYFGHGIYGIENATQFFLHKPAYAVSLAESALMIAIINSPGTYSPLINEDLAYQRKNDVLQRMFDQGSISLVEMEQATKEVLTIYGTLLTDYSPNGYYSDAVMEELNTLGLLTEENRQKGLTIETYLDRELQTKVDTFAQSIDGLDNVQIATVLMRPYSGQVLALIGGFDYEKSPFNRALYATRQTGSSIKPLLYYLALNQGMTPISTFTSEETTFFIRDLGSYTPHNYLDKYANRDITMIEALAVSDNIYAIKTTLFLGSAMLVNLLAEFGIEAPELPSIGLGVADITPLQLTSIYNTFASEGVYYRPRFIKSVTTSLGKVIYQDNSKGTQLLNGHTTLVLNQMMRAPFSNSMDSYTAPSLRGYQVGIPFGGKTGSTSSDAWVLAYNPTITMGIWIGNDEGNDITRTGLAKQYFLKLATDYSRTQKPVWYSPSSLLTVRQIDPISGKDDEDGELYYFRV